MPYIGATYRLISKISVRFNLTIGMENICCVVYILSSCHLTDECIYKQGNRHILTIGFAIKTLTLKLFVSVYLPKCRVLYVYICVKSIYVYTRHTDLSIGGVLAKTKIAIQRYLLTCLRAILFVRVCLVCSVGGVRYWPLSRRNSVFNTQYHMTSIICSANANSGFVLLFPSKSSLCCYDQLRTLYNSHVWLRYWRHWDDILKVVDDLALICVYRLFLVYQLLL